MESPVRFLAAALFAMAFLGAQSRPYAAVTPGLGEQMDAHPRQAGFYRMHDKTAIFDGTVAITGGRNMADEYYDYNFRDRDVLLAGGAVADMQTSFERFWNSELAVPVETQLAGAKHLTSEAKTRTYRQWLTAYADDSENFAPAVRAALRRTAPVFAIDAKTLVIDGENVFVGTFNLDLRSANLNTEVGALIHDPSVASRVEKSIERDMRPENRWNPASELPDAQVVWWKRIRLWFWELWPLEPIL